MNKLTPTTKASLLVLACVFSCEVVCCARDNEGVKEPPQLAALRTTFEARKQGVLKPILSQYLTELDRLEKTLVQNNNLDGALQVRKEKESASQQFYEIPSRTGGQAKEPQQLTVLRNTYDSRKQLAITPLLAQHQADLDRLQRTLAQSGDLSGALAVRNERTGLQRMSVATGLSSTGNLIESIPLPPGWQKATGPSGAFVWTQTHEVKLTLPDVFKPPFVLRVKAMTDSTNIRVFYGKKGVVAFNWERNPKELRFHDPATGDKSGIPDKGAVTKNQWHDIVWDMKPHSLEILVDGRRRYACSGNYADIEGQLSVAAAHGSKVSVQSFVVEK